MLRVFTVQSILCSPGQIVTVFTNRNHFDWLDNNNINRLSAQTSLASLTHSVFQINLKPSFLFSQQAERQHAVYYYKC